MIKSLSSRRDSLTCRVKRKINQGKDIMEFKYRSILMLISSKEIKVQIRLLSRTSRIVVAKKKGKK